jgi:drug/metabolite transporter superfamily protein YnfA
MTALAFAGAALAEIAGCFAFWLGSGWASRRGGSHQASFSKWRACVAAVLIVLAVQMPRDAGGEALGVAIDRDLIGIKLVEERFVGAVTWSAIGSH